MYEEKEEGFFTPEAKLILKVVIGGFVGIFLLIVLFTSWGTIEAGERGVQTRGGKVIGEVIDPGYYFIRPFTDSMNILNVQTQAISFVIPTAEQAGKVFPGRAMDAASSDQQQATVQIVANYRIDPRDVQRIYSTYKSVEYYQQTVLEPLVERIVKGIIPGYTASNLISMRDEVSGKISTAVADEIKRNGAISEQVNLTDIRFSKQYTDAIEAKVTAQQNAEKAQNDLARVGFEADQKIEQARGEAESIRIQAEAVSKTGGKDYVALQWIEAWRNGGSKVPTFITGGNGGNFLYNLGELKPIE